MRLAKKIVFFIFLLVFVQALASHSSENYSITGISINGSGTDSNSENYSLYGAGEAGISGTKTEGTDYNLWIGFASSLVIPRTPGNLSLTVNSQSQISINWDSNGNSTGTSYQLQQTSPAISTLYLGTDNNFAHTGLTARTLYCYKARSFNGAFTTYTSPVCATTPRARSSNQGSSEPEDDLDQEESEEDSEESEETEPETVEVFEKTLIKESTVEEIKEQLVEIGVPEEELEKAVEAMKKIQTERSITVEKTTHPNTETTSFKTTFSVKITNPGKHSLKNIKLIEVIPKSIAESASEIESDTLFIVIEEDPVIQFILDEINPEESGKITYSVNKEVKEESFEAMTGSLVVGLQEEIVADLCENINCSDGKPCTFDSCNPKTGKCSHIYSPVATGCKTETEQTINPEQVNEPQSFELPETAALQFGAVIVAIVLIAFLLRLKKPKTPLEKMRKKQSKALKHREKITNQK